MGGKMDQKTKDGLQGFAIFAVGIAIWTSWPSTPKTPEEFLSERTKTYCTNSGLGRAQAEASSEAAITKKLKAPSTTEFGGDEAHYVKGCEWRVSGYVDAQNAFGARIRMPWVSSLTFHPEHDTYTISANLVQ